MKAILFLLFLGTLFAHNADAHQRTWPGKRLAEMMPAANKFTERSVTLSSDQIAWVEKSLGESIRTEDKTPSFYVAVDGGGRSLGVVVFVDATGENGKIEIGVAIDVAGAVTSVALFEHSESGAVASKEFLGQFSGKKAADKFKVGDDVKAPSGGGKAAQAISTTTRRALLLAMAGLRLGTK